MTKYELVAVTKKIINDVNEINKKYNEKLATTKTYIDGLAAIEDKYPSRVIMNELDKQMKINHGTNYTEKFTVTVSLGADQKLIEEDLKKQRKEYIDARKKEMIDLYTSRWDNKHSERFNDIMDSLIINQVDASDLQTLCNTIKASLI